MTDIDLLDRLRRLDAASLADAGMRVFPPEIRPLAPLAPGTRMVGRALTADTGDDLMSVLGALARGGPGDVLVIATRGARRAVAGELFATEALRRGIAGVVVDGYCRDLATLARLPLPVFARGVTPRAAPARAVPAVGVTLRIGDIDVHPGEFVLGDDDGLVVGDAAEMALAAAAAEAIQAREEPLRLSIQDGSSLFDHVNFADHAERLSRGEESSLSFH